MQLKTSETDSWESAQRLAGEACGTEAAASTAIEETRAVLEQQAARLRAHRGRTVAVAFVQGDQLLVLPGTAIGARIVAELGMTVLETADGAGEFHSLERIPDVLGEVDLIVSFDQGQLPEQAANARFRSLPAVQAGRYVALPADIAVACYQESSLSLRWAATGVADAILAAAEGRGIRP